MTDPAGEPPASSVPPHPPEASDPVRFQRLDPAVVLRPGRVDSAAVLALWFLRRSWVPLFLVGLAIAALLGRIEDPLDLGSPAAIGRGILSAWSGVALAVVVRFGSGILGLSLALPLTTWGERDDYRVGRSSGWLRHARDRWQRMTAYRALRWTWPVRQLAAQRLGRSRRWLLVMERSWSVATVVAGVVLVAALVRSGP